MDSSDTTLLPLCFALIAYVLTRPPEKIGRRVLLLSLLFALSLWAKVTSSLALIAGSVFYMTVFRDRAEKGFSSTIIAGISGGLVLFMLTWSAVSLTLWGSESWAFVLATPLRYFSPGLPPSGGGLIFKWGLDLARIVFWFSPFLLYLSFARIREVFAQGVSAGASHFPAFLCVFYFAGHILIEGSNYGFPRYHAAISPLLHVFAGIAPAEGIGLPIPAPQWKLIVPVCIFSVLVLFLRMRHSRSRRVRFTIKYPPQRVLKQRSLSPSRRHCWRPALLWP